MRPPAPGALRTPQNRHRCSDALRAPSVIPWLSEQGTEFPPTAQALAADTPAPGLLAAGGDLSVPRLRAAYRRGIFPWYSEGEPILWWSPAPRMVLPVAEFKLTPSLKKTLRRFAATPGCEVRVDSAFTDVIAACAAAPRRGQHGTWINAEIIAAYTGWHGQGEVHSFETWVDGCLAGGLYGIGLGRMFYGESMFARRTDASKIALAALVCFCREHGIDWVDCQQETAHLASMGARPVPREQFEAHLRGRVDARPVGDWTYHSAHWRHLLPALPEASSA